MCWSFPGQPSTFSWMGAAEEVGVIVEREEMVVELVEVPVIDALELVQVEL